MTDQGTRLHGIILGSGRGHRRLDTTQSEPVSLAMVDDAEPVLSWALHALAEVGVDMPTYVGGYHIEKVVERFPDLRYRFHSGWRNEGEIGALLSADGGVVDDLLLVSAGTVVLPAALKRILEVDSPFVAGQAGSGSRCGILSVRADHLPELWGTARALFGSDPRATIDALADALGAQLVDVEAEATPVWDGPALARTLFRGKARTLEQLRPVTRSAVVVDLVRFTIAEWTSDRGAVLQRMKDLLPGGPLVVRSSAAAEDSLRESGAGRFRSVLGVHAESEPHLIAAVDTVIESYRRDGRDALETDEVLVQPEVGDLDVSGVILTRDINTAAPYFVINADPQSGRSDVVTSGDGDVETFYVAWSAGADDRWPPYVARCLATARELMGLMCLDSLDIEFGIDRSGVFYLF